MELNLSGKIALVTGSSKGIGKSIAKVLLEEGCKVVLNGRQRSSLKSAAKSLGNKVDYFVADVTDLKKCKELVGFVKKKYGKLDILVCNVGRGRSVPQGKETSKEWTTMLNLNFLSATSIIKEAQESLAKSKGSIVCISSIAGIEATGAPIAYSTAKAALNAYVKGVSRPFAKIGIRINAVAPGNIFFEGSVWEKKLSQNPLDVKKILEKEVPMKRFGQPEEVANLVTYLVSPISSFITGSIFVIDGGQTKT